MRCSLVSVKKKKKSCTFPERGRRVPFTKPNDDLPKYATTLCTLTDGPEVTVMYTGQNQKSNTLRLGLDNG